MNSTKHASKHPIFLRCQVACHQPSQNSAQKVIQQSLRGVHIEMNTEDAPAIWIHLRVSAHSS